MGPQRRPRRHRSPGPGRRPPRGRALSGPPRVLLVESNRPLADALAGQLFADGYRVDVARTAAHARILARGDAPDVAVIGELDLPHGPVGLLEEIRRSPASTWSSSLPVIVVGRGLEPLELLRAFEAGADDFVSRPSYLELRVRLRALVRRVTRPGADARALSIGELTIDPSSRAVTLGGRAVRLRRLEFDLLYELASDPARVFTRCELLKVVWGYRGGGSTRTLESHASRLRKALQDRDQRWIVSVRGVGYRLR